MVLTSGSQLEIYPELELLTFDLERWLSQIKEKSYGSGVEYTIS